VVSAIKDLNDAADELTTETLVVETHQAAGGIEEDLEALDIEKPRWLRGAKILDEGDKWPTELMTHLASGAYPTPDPIHGFWHPGCQWVFGEVDARRARVERLRSLLGLAKPNRQSNLNSSRRSALSTIRRKAWPDQFGYTGGFRSRPLMVRRMRCATE
jgi:hypothetical protein